MFYCCYAVSRCMNSLLMLDDEIIFFLLSTVLMSPDIVFFYSVDSISKAIFDRCSLTVYTHKQCFPAFQTEC